MDELIAWSSSNGGTLSPAVEVFHDAATGYSFRVKSGHSLQQGDAIVSCSLGITLSYLNTLDVDLSSHSIPSPQERNVIPFPNDFLRAVPPHIAARFFLIQQYLLGSQSFWYPYIRNLPQPDNPSAWSLPPFWPSDDIDLLEGTNVYTTLHEIKARLRVEHNQASAALEAASFPGSRGYSRNLYHWAYTIFTTRSFRPSRVIPNPETLPLPAGCGIDDFHVLMPLFDIGNHSPLAEVDWHQAVAGDGDGQTSKTPVTFLTTRTPYAAGEQVFNNYGPKTNPELFLAYGFTVPESELLHNDYVHLQLKIPSANPGSDSKPRDFFFSLKPTTDPSSVTARKNLTLPGLDANSIIPPFRHVQDTLIWELIRMQTTPEQRESLLPVSDGTSPAEQEQEQDAQRLRQVLTGKTRADFRPVLEQTMAIIQAKAFQELEKLEESDFEIEGVEGVTPNQVQAYDYRTQCRKVLINVLESLEMPSSP